MGSEEHKYSEFVKILRKTRKIKYSEIKVFSKAVKIPKSLLYQYEIGRTFPPIENFIKICNCLNKSLTYLLSPNLKLSKSEQEILHIFEGIEIKEILNDKQISDILKFSLLGFEILL